MYPSRIIFYAEAVGGHLFFHVLSLLLQAVADGAVALVYILQFFLIKANSNIKQITPILYSTSNKCQNQVLGGRWCHLKFSRVGLVTKPNSPVASAVSLELGKYLESQGLLVVHTGMVDRLSGETVPSITDMAADLIVVVGGDGTVMRTAQQAGVTPLLGVKVGALGFLCETTPDSAKQALERVLSGRFYLDHKTKLKVTYKDVALPDVLNEALVTTSKPSKILSLLVKKDGEPIHRGKADGVIVSTTTGSTAYALSAGGSIIDPQVDVLEVVFICPLSAGLRPLIFPRSSSIEINILPEAASGMVVLDGQAAQEVDYDVPLLISSSEHPATFIRINPPGFYGRIREKIKGLEV
jgi:NAD+ kinase